MKQRILIAVALAVSAVAGGARAEDLGVKAQTYALDRDAADQIKDVMRRKKASGEMDQFWKTYRSSRFRKTTRTRTGA
jgi:conjugal transfer pilus assembly protein TraW